MGPLWHTPDSEAVRKVQAVRMDVPKALQFSQHKDLKTPSGQHGPDERMLRGRLRSLVAG